MKKLLALVLALVMTLSLCVVSSNAAYTDKADIDLKEAVDVLTAVGVFQGSDGKFDPKANLTREQAAKLVAYLQIGQKAADALVGGGKFTDVAKTAWSAGYVDYCASIGIAAGVGDGKFDPTGSLTALQFGKMLLVCLGYDAKAEGLTGADWQINTSKLMSSASLLSGLKDVTAYSVVTREQAAQMMLNALKAPMVEYANKATSISVNGADIVFGGSNFNYVTSTVAANSSADNIDDTCITNSNGDIYTVELGEKLFSKLVLKNPTDAFGRPSNYWTLAGQKIGQYAKTPTLTYTTKVSASQLYLDLGIAKIDKDRTDAKFDNLAKAVYVNGDDTDATAIAHSAYEIKKANTSEKFGGQGVLTEVFVDSNNQVTIVEINYYAGEITSATAATASKDAYVTVAPKGDNKGNPAGKFTTDDSFTVGDVVYYTYSFADGEKCVESVVKAESVTGTVKGYTSKTSVTLDETVYKYNAKVGKEAATANVSATLYLDGNGNVIYVDGKTSDKYAYVLSTPTQDAFGTYNAKLLLADGKIVKAVLTNTSAGGIAEKEFVSYTTNAAGEYTLALLTTKKTSTNGADVKNGRYWFDIDVSSPSTSINDVNGTDVFKANGKTIFLVKTKDANNDPVYTSYTGIANVPTISVANGDGDASVYAKTSTLATIVFIDATDADEIYNSSSDVIFVKNNGEEKTTTYGIGDYYAYDCIVNGVVKEDVKIAKNTPTGLYNNVHYDDNDVITSLTPVTNKGLGVLKLANNVLGYGAFDVVGTFFNTASNCQVWFMDEDGDLRADDYTPASVVADASDYVWFDLNASGVITTVVVKKVADLTYVVGFDANNGADAAGDLAALPLNVPCFTYADDPDNIFATGNNSFANQPAPFFKHDTGATVTLVDENGALVEAAISRTNLTAYNGLKFSAGTTYKYNISKDGVLLGVGEFTKPAAPAGA